MATTEIKSLLHFDESATKDEVGEVTWTAEEGAILSSNNKKFGSNSLYLPKAFSYIKANTNSLNFYNYRSNVYEVEFWAYISSDNDYDSPIYPLTWFYENNIALQFYLTQHTERKMEIVNGSVVENKTISYNCGLKYIYKGQNSSNELENFNSVMFEDLSEYVNKWHHFLLRYSHNNRVYIFVDGKIKCNVCINEDYYVCSNSTADKIILGNFIGYVDEFAFRIIDDSDGVTNRYTYGEPTIPTTAYTYVKPSEPEPEPEPEPESIIYDSSQDDFNKEVLVPEVLQLRGGTKAVLAAVNPILARREIMVEVDTGQMKIGTGTRRWNNLKYVGDF